MVIDGREVMVHVANSGRMRELLAPDNRMWVAPAPSTAHRKTAYDLALVEVDGVLVSADARLPNVVLREAIEAGKVSELAGYDTVAREVPLYESRVDLLLTGPPGRCYVEAKSVTLVEDGVGLFPDAPTERGRKHVMSLHRAVRRGDRAAVVFVIQRSDAHSLTPNEPSDPRFCETLRAAVADGLEAYAFRCEVTLSRVDLADSVPVTFV